MFIIYQIGKKIWRQREFQTSEGMRPSVVWISQEGNKILYITQSRDSILKCSTGFVVSVIAQKTAELIRQLLLFFLFFLVVCP